ncbi:hypothetical protein TrVE_jg6408 [Triparma verrucosa]|uniref:EF-hand domain-containing family member C2 n=1 Tax=Triparma verrucosa TaxID=1606542 RepID=A0A9W7CJW4_9STRA|nr:hypothetical protein TrVE_jg6408 [Triparma verrucosa]
MTVSNSNFGVNGASFQRPSSSSAAFRPGTSRKMSSLFPNLPGFRRPNTSVGGQPNVNGTSVIRFNQNQSLNYQNGIMMISTSIRPSTASATPEAIDSFKMLDSQHYQKDALHPDDMSGRYSLTRQRLDHKAKTGISSNLVVGKIGRRVVPATSLIRSGAGFPRDGFIGGGNSVGSEEFSLTSAYTASPNNLAPLPPVLLFQGYYFEDIIESQIEDKRIHRCDIYYYTEDGSVEIIEQKTENSGMPQGSILRRGKVNGITAGKFRVGENVEIYARSYSIISCNESTREYCRNVLNFPESALRSLPWPEDTFIKKNTEKMMRETGFGNVNRNRKMHPQKEYMEALLGKPSSMTDLGSFLTNGQKCLCFDMIWDDTQKLYGDVRLYKMNFYLSDDTMEILPVHSKNDGRDQFPKLLKRSKVPKDIHRPEGAKYTWQDLNIGKVLNIYQRPMTIAAADPFTRKFYTSKGMHLGNNININPSVDVHYERQIPPYNGFGSEEDSLRSCTGSIKPLPVKKEFHYDKRGQVIRFNARLVSKKSEDKNRRFVIQYFLEDNTLAIREPPIRNSGVIGGNFLRRSPCKHPDGTKVKCQDFYVGAILDLNCHRFLLMDADEWSYRLMENDHEGNFPYSSFERLFTILQGRADALEMYFTQHRELNLINFQDLERCFQAIGPKLKKQELITIWRKIDRKNKGKVSFTKLIKVAKGVPIHVSIMG